MKVAVFHNFLDNIGGAEIVALTLTRELKADLYTTNIAKDKISQMGYGDVVDRIYSVGRIPKQAPWRQQLALFKFRQLNLKGKYDFYIIAGDWAMSGAVNHHPNLWYVHSPLNELWEFTSYIKKNLLSFWKKPLFDLFVAYNRWLTKRYGQSVDNWACNSLNTKKRIAKYYKQTASIIYPPIDINKYYYQGDEKYWLSVNRLATHKKIELQLDAFKLLPDKKLIIIGSYEQGVRQFENYKKLLEANKPANVAIKHWVSEEELIKLYANCSGFISTSKNEDFGMNVVEAMASGKPVIAPNDGGYKESIINNETGYLIDDIDGEKLKNKILEIEHKLNTNPLYYQTICQKQSQKFSQPIFIDKIKTILNNFKKDE